MTCSSKGHPLALDVFEDIIYWVTTIDYGRGRHQRDAAAMLTMNKFTHNMAAASHDVVAILHDVHTELNIAHPALQISGQYDSDQIARPRAC